MWLDGKGNQTFTLIAAFALFRPMLVDKKTAS
jgi:hypothetical protein